jgi:protein TonB
MRAVCQITVVPSAAFQIAIPANYQRNLLGLTAVPTINLSMGYQALLFCPDEKTARTVTQVLSELDFSVDPCNEPFAAVKKLMAQHFDAIVVDCDNEQNAALLFKGARGSASNQMSLAVAVVEGQAGVAKAFRIGANLVLTKPINMEQAKGTLRVARGLLRKGETAKSAAPAASAPPPVSAPGRPFLQGKSPVAAASAIAGAIARPVVVETRPQTSARSPMVKTPTVAASANSSLSPASDVKRPEAVWPTAPVQPSSAALRPPLGAASAPAPAKEIPAPAAEKEVPVTEIAPVVVIPEPVQPESSVTPVAAYVPSFSFGGANASAEPAQGGSKKMLLAIAAIVLLGAAAYLGWTQLRGNANPAGTVPQPAASSPAQSSRPSAVPSPQIALPVPTPAVKVTPPRGTPSDSELATPSEFVGTGSTAPQGAHKTAPAAPPASSLVEGTTPRATPNVVKHDAFSAAPAKTAPVEETPSAPSMAVVAGAVSGGALPSLLASPAKVAKPVLQTLNVSQGVSEGLLLKKVQPMYPTSALRLRVQGPVQLLATIGKNGNITAVKVVSGDASLSRAASDAVKQWKYKPYYLNGEPIEIKTDVTVNFKLPN